MKLNDIVCFVTTLIVIIVLGIVVLKQPKPHVYKCTTDIECEMEERSLN